MHYNENWQTLPKDAYAPFLAMAQGEHDYLVEVFPIGTEEFGILMTIGAEEGAIYITREQARIFFNFAN